MFSTVCVHSIIVYYEIRIIQYGYIYDFICVCLCFGVFVLSVCVCDHSMCVGGVYWGIGDSVMHSCVGMGEMVWVCIRLWCPCIVGGGSDEIGHVGLVGGSAVVCLCIVVDIAVGDVSDWLVIVDDGFLCGLLLSHNMVCHVIFKFLAIFLYFIKFNIFYFSS